MEAAGPERQIAERYRLSHVIGRGGMGVVWQARDEILGRDVAVKELLWPACHSPEEQQAACRRAVREARVAARLTHRNVVRIFDIIEEDGCPWIVMELLPPRSLRDLIQEEGVLSPARAAEVGLGILAALRAAHAAGIVHLDVKPANIVLAQDRVVLTDFGIARSAGTPAATTVGVLIGSPSYMAPERARGGRPGPPADLWGLGASLYAAVEGHGPFDRDGGALASLTAAVTDEPEPAVHAGPLLWPVISGLLRKDPDTRLDADQAERMLRRVAGPLAVPVGAASAGAASAGAASAGAVQAGSVQAGVVAPRPRRSRARTAALAGVAAVAVLAVSGTVAALELTGSPSHTAAAAVAPPSPVSPRTPTASASLPAAGKQYHSSAALHLTADQSRAHGPRSSSAHQNAGDPAAHQTGLVLTASPSGAKPVKPPKPAKAPKPPKPVKPPKPPKPGGGKHGNRATTGVSRRA